MSNYTPESKSSAVLQFARVRYAESRARVRYKETDQMGIAHHSNYFVWFEIGRTDLCRETGIPYAEIERRGYLLVVTEIGCRFRTPFRYDDEVLIRTSVGEIGSRAMQFSYELYDAAANELRASGFSAHLWLDIQSRKPVRADAEVMRAFAPYLPEPSAGASR
jgi:acyl-CoA thioester hydrolase